MRFPGLALPSTFLFYQQNPLPLHLYDFALHVFHNWRQERALSFYVPKAWELHSLGRVYRPENERRSH